MTVAELKAVLESIPDEYPIYLSVDPEGNGFRTVEDVEVDNYIEDGEASPVHPDDVDEYLPEELFKAVTIWP